jgi:hypothetical protein
MLTPQKKVEPIGELATINKGLQPLVVGSLRCLTFQHAFKKIDSAEES